MAFNGMHSNDPPFNGKQSPKIKIEYGNGEGNGMVGYTPQNPRIKKEYGNEYGTGGGNEMGQYIHQNPRIKHDYGDGKGNGMGEYVPQTQQSHGGDRMGGVALQHQQPHGEGIGMNPYLPQRLTQADATAGHIWKDTRNHGSRGRDRSPRDYSSRDHRSRSRSTVRHRSRSRDQRRLRSYRSRSRSTYRRRSTSRDRRRSRSSRGRSDYRSRSRSRDRRRPRSSRGRRSRYRSRSRSRDRRRSRSSEGRRRSRSPRERDRPSRRYSTYPDSREVKPFPRSLTIDPTLLPRQVMVPQMVARQLPPRAQGGASGNNIGGGSSVGTPSIPQGSLLDRRGCVNCGQMGHTKEECPQRCRKCGPRSHRTEGCVCRDVCACEQFPGHIRRDCRLVCLNCKDRKTYDGHRAMNCKRRCAVCGSWQHSTSGCHVRCGCARGGYHLGQVHIDENVDCGACGRYHCPRHCRNCGGDFHSEASCRASIVEEKIPGERRRILQCSLPDHPTFRFGKNCKICHPKEKNRDVAATESRGEDIDFDAMSENVGDGGAGFEGAGENY